jgi:hypothetical protein
LAGLYSIGYLGWAISQGTPMGTDSAVQREIERAKTPALPFDPAIHAFGHESYDEALERHERMKQQPQTPDSN